MGIRRRNDVNHTVMFYIFNSIAKTQQQESPDEQSNYEERVQKMKPVWHSRRKIDEMRITEKGNGHLYVRIINSLISL